jgi:hypothetical protein
MRASAYARQNETVPRRAVTAGLGALYIGAFAVASLALKTTPSDLDYFFWPATETAVGGHPLLVYSTHLTIISANDNGPIGLVPLIPIAVVANALHVAGNLGVRTALVDGVMAIFVLLLAYQSVRLVTRSRGPVAWPLAAAASIALAPAVWIGILDYGHVEQPVELCLVLLGVKLAMSKRSAATGVALGAAVLARTVALFTAMPLLLIALAAGRLRSALLTAGAGALTVVIGLAPFVVADHAAVVHSLVGYRGTLPIVGGSFWVLARGSLWPGVAQHWDAGIAAALAVALVVVTLVRRPATPTTVAELIGLLTIASCCLPLVAKTVFPYYLVEPAVLSTVWWLARPGSARNWRVAIPLLLNADVFITKAGTTVTTGPAWSVEGVASSVLIALVIAMVTADLFRNSPVTVRA